MDTTTVQAELAAIARHVRHYRAQGLTRYIPREYAHADTLLDQLLDETA